MEIEKVTFRISCDPGCARKGYAFAFFVHEPSKPLRLNHCGMASSLTDFLSDFVSFNNDLTHFAMEIPVVRQTAHQRGSQKDIVNLAIAAGKVLGEAKMKFPDCTIQEVLPEQWKGQLPKEIANMRTFNALRKDEKEAFESGEYKKSNANDVLDAIGIGLHHWDRQRALI